MSGHSVLRRADWPVAGFTFAYLAVASPYALATGNQEFVFYILVLLVLAAAVLAVHRAVCLHVATLWCLSLWGCAHLAGGLLPLAAEGAVLYDLWLVPGRLKYDQVVHAFGFAVTTWVCWQALRPALRDPRPTFGRMVLCTAAGMGFGALNEVVEFCATLLVSETNVGGYQNTGWDLVANLSGACVAAAAIYWRGRG